MLREKPKRALSPGFYIMFEAKAKDKEGNEVPGFYSGKTYDPVPIRRAKRFEFRHLAEDRLKTLCMWDEKFGGGKITCNAQIILVPKGEKRK